MFQLCLRLIVIHASLFYWILLVRFEHRQCHDVEVNLTYLKLFVFKGKGLPQQAEVAQGVPGRLRPRIFLTFDTYEGGRSSALRTGRLYPRRNPWYSCLEAESSPGHMVPSVATEIIPCDTTGNRSRDLPTSSAVR